MAAALINPLLVTGVVAIIAYLTNSRSAFFCGIIGCWLAATVAPEPSRGQWRSAEAAYMHNYNETVARSGRAVIGGIVGTAVGLVLFEIGAWRTFNRQNGTTEHRR